MEGHVQRTKSCIRQMAFIPMFRTLSFKDSMTVFLFISNTLVPGCGISGYDWTGTCLLRQFTNLPCFLLSSFSFLTVIGGPREASRYFLLWSCINNEIVYKRPVVSPLVTVLQMQAQHWRHHALYCHAAGCHATRRGWSGLRSGACLDWLELTKVD